MPKSSIPSSIEGGRRPFRLLHLMALVAVIALTLVGPPALVKTVVKSYPLGIYYDRSMYFDGLVAITLGGWTLLLAPIALVENRSRLRRASRSYGTSAVFAAALALGLLLAARVYVLLLQAASYWAMPEFTFVSTLQATLYVLVYDGSKVASAAILTAWSSLRLTRAGRRPEAWPEILYLFLGLCWISWYFLGPLMHSIRTPWMRAYPFPS